MNGKQFVEEILEPHLIPYWESLNDSEGSRLIEDGLKVHSVAAAQAVREAHGIKKDDWL